MNISGNTSLLAVIGNPSKHSLSPKLQNYLIEKCGVDYVYTAFEPEGFDAALIAMKTLGIKGYNVTTPFKTEAFKSVDILDKTAILCGEVNTIVNNNGVLTGYCTDGDGLYLSLKYNDITIKDKKIIVLGCGGAARAVCVMLAGHSVKKVLIKNRTVSKAVDLCKKLNSEMNTDVFEVYSGGSADIIINATSVGLGSLDTPINDKSIYRGAEACVDLIYHPRKTTFLSDAENRGIKAVNGLGMLAFQGIIAFEKFTGEKVPENLYTEVLDLLNE